MRSFEKIPASAASKWLIPVAMGYLIPNYGSMGEPIEDTLPYRNLADCAAEMSLHVFRAGNMHHV